MSFLEKELICYCFKGFQITYEHLKTNKQTVLWLSCVNVTCEDKQVANYKSFLFFNPGSTTFSKVLKIDPSDSYLRFLT